MGDVLVEVVSDELIIMEMGFEGSPGRDATFPEGEPGQVVSFDAEGRPIAIDPGSAALPDGEPGQVLLYDANGVAVPSDPPIPLTTTNW